MSMIGYLGSIGQRQILAFRANPDLISAYTKTAMQSAHDEMLASLPSDVRAQYQEQLERARQDLAASMGQIYAAPDATVLEGLGPFQPMLKLGKDWHALHYLLGGHVDFEGSVGDSLLGGEPLGEGYGYGPDRLLSPSDTAAFSAFLAPLDAVHIIERFNLAEMTRVRVYSMPRFDHSDELNVWITSLGAQFKALKAYVDKASGAGNAILLWIA